MLTSEYAAKTNAKVINFGTEKHIKNAYAGDFLSFVISSAKDSCIWFTVMNNVNVAGVAVLIDCACIVLCENVLPDKDLADKCKKNDITLFCTVKGVYEACIEFNKL